MNKKWTIEPGGAQIAANLRFAARNVAYQICSAKDRKDFRNCFDFIPSFYRNIPMGCLTLISIDSFTERKSLLDCKLHAVDMSVR